MAKASSSIDLSALKVAGTNATGYITDIGNDGIRIHDANTTNNSIVINSSGMEIFKGGSDSSHSVAKFGADEVQIGADDTTHAELTSGGMAIYMDADTPSVAQFGSTARIGQLNGGHIEIDNTNLSFYNDTTMFGRISKGLFDREMGIGTWTDNYTYGTLSLDGDDGNAVLTVSNGTSSSSNWTSLYLTPTAWSLTTATDNSSTGRNYNTILQLTQSKLALYCNGDTDNDIKLSVIPSTGQLTLAGHSSPIGSQVNGTKVDTSSTAIPDSINVTTGNGTSIARLVLPAGVWIVYGQARFASNSTGYRRMGFSATKNNASLDVTFGASSSGATQISNTRVLSPSSQTTYYLNVTHNGGTTLAVSDIVFSAWRLV